MGAKKDNALSCKLSIDSILLEKCPISSDGPYEVSPSITNHLCDFLICQRPCKVLDFQRVIDFQMKFVCIKDLELA